MKKFTLFVLSILLANFVQAQYLTTSNVTDWGQLWRSGFYESVNVPSAPTIGHIDYEWYWGINMAHSNNNANYRYNGQLVIGINTIFNAPTMFFRCTDKYGVGTWAKVIHDQGNQLIHGDLTVGGTINTREILVSVNAGADHVFHKDYPLKKLTEVQAFILKNKHLPDIPSEIQMQQEGLKINDFQIKLLQKIEELTLYVIQQQKEIEALKAQINK